MFVVRPIAMREQQASVCALLDVPYRADTLAYYAAELAEDRETVTDIIGICQFTVGNAAIITSLFPAAGRETDEAMVVLCRSVMFFLHSAGSKTVTILPTAGPAEMLSRMGLPKSENGYMADLDRFYEAPCKYSADEAKD